LGKKSPGAGVTVSLKKQKSSNLREQSHGSKPTRRSAFSAEGEQTKVDRNDVTEPSVVRESRGKAHIAKHNRAGRKTLRSGGAKKVTLVSLGKRGLAARGRKEKKGEPVPEGKKGRSVARETEKRDCHEGAIADVGADVTGADL